MDKLKRLVEQIGPGLAACVKEGNIPENLQDNLTLKDWGVIKTCATSDELKQLSEKKMEELS